MKTCFKCGESQPLTNFYAHPQMADGFLGKCKSCTKSDATKHRNNNLEKIREYDKNRGKKDPRIKLNIEVTRRWRAEDKRRSTAHNKVAYAIKKGDIKKKPCSICGDTNSLAHHESYDRPLDVIWLCQIHHKERHKQLVLLGITPWSLASFTHRLPLGFLVERAIGAFYL